MEYELIEYVKRVAISEEDKLIAFCIYMDKVDNYGNSLILIYYYFEGTIMYSTAYSNFMSVELKNFIQTKPIHSHIFNTTQVCDIRVTNNNDGSLCGSHVKLISSSKRYPTFLIQIIETGEIKYLQDTFFSYTLDYTENNIKLIDEL